MKLLSNLIFLAAISLSFGSCSSDDEEQLSYAEQLTIDVNIIDAYLAENNIVAETDESGLRYVINEAGTGETPGLNNNVFVKYEGRLLSNNAVFDGNIEDTRFPPAKFALSRLIAGWQVGLPKIKEGGKITLYIPSGLGYGNAGSGSIPPNSNLIFYIELAEVN